jgi:hypothetical protein
MAELSYDDLERANFELRTRLAHIELAYEGSKKALSIWMNAYHALNKKERITIMNRQNCVDMV